MAMLVVIMVPLLLVLSAAPAQARLLRARAATATSHPVEGIITLLKRLDSEADQEGKAEQVTYQKFEHWCARSEKELQDTIAKEKTTLEELADQIVALKGTIDTLGEEINSLTEELGAHGRAESKAEGQRNAGVDLYDDRTQSLKGTIAALKDAITALTDARQNTDSQLLQLRIEHVIEVARTKMSAEDVSLLTTAGSNSTPSSTRRPQLRASGDYEKHIDEYDFKSGGVIELLKKLLQDFEAEQLEVIKGETNAKIAYDLSNAARNDLKQAAVDARGVKDGARADAKSALGDAEGEQRDTNNDLTADQNTLRTTLEACDQKAAEWTERSKVRSKERDAIHTAIGVLAKVSGVRITPPENPQLPQSPVDQQYFFLQLSNNPEFEQALKLLRQDARVSHSKAVSQLAAAIAANGEGPFDQAINSIEKMVFHLQNEQREEDDHKNWCDKEISTSNATFNNKEDKLEELAGKIDVAETRANKLLRETTEADKIVKSIVTHMGEAAEIRKVGREENALAIKDAEAAQAALTQAISVLSSFYKSSGAVQKKDWEFIQQRAPVELKETPETWDTKYTSVADPNDDSNGVLKLLESVLADFSSMESSTIAQEDSDQHAYEQDMKECKIEKARRIKESEMKTADRKNVLERQRALETTHHRVSNEKDATQQYLRDLEPACVIGDSTYADRKTARKQEIDALKMAQDHLHNAFNNVTKA